MILCSLRTYDFHRRSTRIPVPCVAAASVKLDLVAGEDGGMVILPVVELVEITHDLSPCLAAAIMPSCRPGSQQVRSLGSTRVTRLLSDEHPAAIMGWISGISTPTRLLPIVSPINDLDEVLRAIEDGMRKAMHHLMVVRSLRRSSPSSAGVEYWTNVAVRMSDRWHALDQTRITTSLMWTSGLDDTISYILEHPRPKLAWRHG